MQFTFRPLKVVFFASTNARSTKVSGGLLENGSRRATKKLPPGAETTLGCAVFGAGVTPSAVK